MLINIRGIQCAIAHEDGQPGISRRWTEYGPEIAIRFKVAWGAAPSLAAALMGSVALSDDGSLTRVPPYAPPWAPKLYCVGVEDETQLTPRLDTSGWMYFEESILVATFAALTWQIEGGDPEGQGDPSGLPYTTTKFRVSGEVFQPPSGTYYIAPFGADAKLAEEALVGITRPRVEISMTRHLMPRIPLEETMALVGCVNDETIRIANRTFPRGCLLFAGFTTDPRNDSGGFPVQELEYTFLGNYEVEWNEFFGTDGDWHFLNTAKDGTGDFPFSYVDFTPALS